MSVHVFETMGTVVSIHTSGHLAQASCAPVERIFRAYDERFSLYRPDSELSRVADGRLALRDAGEDVRDAYADALSWSTRTLGAFTPHRPDGRLDLSGLVKALAIERAGASLDEALDDWILDCGGDVLERRPPGAVRNAGIADPARRGALLTAVTLGGTRRAIATSGRSERGDHVWGRGSGLRQVTVAADDIVTADVYATAILAGGLELLDALTASADIDALALRDDGEVLATGGIRLAA